MNFEAAVSLSRFAIENKAETLRIVNVSSVSGIYPMPYFAIYSATKAALTSFSVALREEVKKTGRIRDGYFAGCYADARRRQGTN